MPMHTEVDMPKEAVTADPIALMHRWMRTTLDTVTVPWSEKQRIAAEEALTASVAKHAEMRTALQAALPLLTRMASGQPYSQDIARRGRDKVLAALSNLPG